MKVNCQKCGREFSLSPSDVKSGRKNCSAKCYGKAKISSNDLVNDLLRVARELGHRPSLAEYKKLGKYSPRTISYKLGGLQKIWESLGLKYKSNWGISSEVKIEEIIKDLHRVHKELGHPPSSSEYKQIGDHTPGTVKKKLMKKYWHEVIIQALTLSKVERAIITPPHLRDLEMWLDLIRDLQAKLKRPPTCKDANRHISLSHRIKYLREFGFKGILEMAGIDSSNSHSSKLTTNDGLIDDLTQVSIKIGRIPSYGEYVKLGKYHPASMKSHFGSWGKAKELASRQLRLKPQGVKHMSHVPDPSRDRLKESSVEAIKDFFNPVKGETNAR
jgi:hypothetical protein